MMSAVPVSSSLDEWFSLTKRHTRVGIEIRSGIVAFITVAYTIIVIPQIIAGAVNNASLAASLPFASAFVSFIGTAISAHASNTPYILTPGLALTAYMVTVLNGSADEHTYAYVLACSAISGVLITAIGLSQQTSIVTRFVPKHIRTATLIGIGILIAVIGLTRIGLLQTIAAEENTSAVAYAFADLTSVNVWIALMGFVVALTLIYYNITGAIIIAMISTSVVLIAINGLQQTFSFSPPFFTLYADFTALSFTLSTIGIILTLTLTALFDIVGMVHGISSLTATRNDTTGVIEGEAAVYVSSGIATIIASLLGIPGVIVAIESVAGIKDGGRTGLTSFTAAMLFLVSMFVTPLLTLIPVAATAGVLLLVGLMMMAEIATIRWNVLLEAAPALLIILIIPLTGSIAAGLVAGLLLHCILGLTSGEFIRYLYAMPLTQSYMGGGTTADETTPLKVNTIRNEGEPGPARDAKDSDVYVPVHTASTHVSTRNNNTESKFDGEDRRS